MDNYSKVLPNYQNSQYYITKCNQGGFLIIWLNVVLLININKLSVATCFWACQIL